MATATLTYNLLDRDDTFEYAKVVKATDMALALWEFAYNNRRSLERKIEELLKDDDKVSVAYETLDMVYDSFWEIIKDNDLNLDKLVE